MARDSSQLSRKLPVALLPHELELRTWIQMARTFGRIDRLLEQSLAAHGLSVPQFDVLATLHVEQGITQQELAGRLLVTKGNVCGLLDRVESAGWVERRPDDDDRRANRLYLTKRGSQLLAAVAPHHHHVLRRALGAIEKSELQKLFQLLDRLENGLAG